MTVGGYVRILMKQRNLTPTEMIKLMEEQGEKVLLTHFCAFLNNRDGVGKSALWAKRCEKALGLKENSLTSMICN